MCQNKSFNVINHHILLTVFGLVLILHFECKVVEVHMLNPNYFENLLFISQSRAGKGSQNL